MQPLIDIDTMIPQATFRRAGRRALAALWLSLATAAAAPAQQLPAAAPMQVGTITLQRQAVPRVFTLPGRAVAQEAVDIRPRVDGVIEEILFSPGRPLKVGDPLYQLDDASYRADVAAAEASVASAEAGLDLAQVSYDRAASLKNSGYTVAQVDEARATLAEAQATLDSARAALDFARTRLSWTTIRSPIEGVASVSTVSVGALVTSAQSDALTTVTRLDPIDVDMMETSARMLAIRTEIEAGTLQSTDRVDVALTLENGQVYQGSGVLVAPGNTVSTTTGTVRMRFRFDNPDRRILPGMFVRGEVTLGRIEAFLVPQRAATRDRLGRLTGYVVGDDGTARQVELTEIGSRDNAWIVTGGVDEGDRLIVDGMKSMRDGLAVSPVAATLDPSGLVQTTAPAAED